MSRECEVKPITYGESDKLRSQVAKGKVHVLKATIVNQLDFDHKKLTHRFQGTGYRLTDVHGEVVQGIVACDKHSNRRAYDLADR